MIMPQLTPEEQKEIIKNSLKEWMNEQFASFGRWTFYGMMAAAFAGLVYLSLSGMGWHK